MNEKIQNEAFTYEFGPKGHSQVPMRRRAFPLEEEIQSMEDKTVVSTDFETSYSEDNGDVLEAVTTLNPYLHPQNQILLQALIKLNSIKNDVVSLVSVSNDPTINEVQVKPMTLKEGLQIAQNMSPYLSPGVTRQVNNVVSKINTIEKIRSNTAKIQTAETTDIKVQYVLENLKMFIPSDTYKQIKQLVSTVQLLQTFTNTAEEGDEEEVTPDTPEISKEEQLSEIVDLLDNFSKKKEAE